MVTAEGAADCSAEMEPVADADSERETDGVTVSGADTDAVSLAVAASELLLLLVLLAVGSSVVDNVGVVVSLASMDALTVSDGVEDNVAAAHCDSLCGGHGER